ncbi:MAG: cysteine hydrolase [Deltaproteobacteria bacterium]|nr:cysteine hydrolase [Deltaproteobacteria bacterium]
MKKTITTALTLLSIGAQAERPQTLLEMSGARVPFDKKAAALVLIDFQNEYVSGRLPLPKIEAVVGETRRLLEWARARKMPVIHVFHQGQTGGLFDVSVEAGKVIAELAPKAGEVVIYKVFPNAFNGTELERVIRKEGRTSILFAGLMTHMCLDASVRAAFDKGFHSAVVASTTATRALPGVGGAALDAEVLKRASLASLQDLVALIIPSVNDLR